MASRIIYQVLLFLLAFVAIPKMLYMRFKYGKYKNSFSKRFGKDFPEIKKENRYLIWIHAVSFGETRAIAGLAKKLKEQNPDALFVVSSITETGHAEAKKSLSFADYHVYLPFDFTFIVNRIVKQSPPDLLIFCETDLWYNFMTQAKKLGSKIIVVNAKLSTRSLSRFLKIPKVAKSIYNLVDLFCAQTPVYKENLESIGVSPNKIIVTGNIKLDDVPVKLSSEELLTWKQSMGIKETDKLIVFGSTHSPEEKLLLNACQTVWQKFPNLKVLLVPRHPERFDEVANLLKTENIPYARHSDLSNVTGNEKVVLVDAMGILKKCYQVCDIALVAGSFTDRIGGHNIIEPCWFGKPVIYGPHMFTQADLVALIKQYNAGMQVGIDELPSAIIELLDDTKKTHHMSAQGIKLTQEAQGATEKTLKAIDRFLNH